MPAVVRRRWGTREIIIEDWAVMLSGRCRPIRSVQPSARSCEARCRPMNSGGRRAKRTWSAGTERSRCPGADRRPRRRTGHGRRRAHAARSGGPDHHHGGQPGRGHRCARARAWQPARCRAGETRLAGGLGARGAGGGPLPRAAGRRVAGALIPSAASTPLAGRLHRPRCGCSRPPTPWRHRTPRWPPPPANWACACTPSRMRGACGREPCRRKVGRRDHSGWRITVSSGARYPRTRRNLSEEA